MRAFAAILFVFASSASADTITSFASHNCGNQVSTGTITACGLMVQYPFLPSSKRTLFNVVVGPGDTGLIFSADSSNPNFDVFVSMLTNGVDDILETSTRQYRDGAPYVGNGSSRPESAWFASFPTLTGIDLVGYQITSIDLRVDSVTVLPPTPRLPFPGLSVQASLVFHGVCVEPGGCTVIPEPGTGLLVMTGLLGLATRRKRRA